MLGVQEYMSICCGVVCYVYSNYKKHKGISSRSIQEYSSICSREYSSSMLGIYSSIAVASHNIQKHNYYYMYVLYINNV